MNQATANNRHVSIVMPDRREPPAIIINPGPKLGLTIYKAAIVTLYLLTVAKVYGTFTNGLPPKFSYVYVSAWLYDIWNQSKAAYINLWLFTEVFKKWTLTRTALILRRNQCWLWFVFSLIIYFIAEIGHYHYMK